MLPEIRNLLYIPLVPWGNEWVAFYLHCLRGVDMSHDYHMTCMTTPLLQKAVLSPYWPEQRNVLSCTPVLSECANRSWPPRGGADRHLHVSQIDYIVVQTFLWLYTTVYSVNPSSKIKCYTYTIGLWVSNRCQPQVCAYITETALLMLFPIHYEIKDLILEVPRSAANSKITE